MKVDGLNPHHPAADHDYALKRTAVSMHVSSYYDPSPPCRASLICMFWDRRAYKEPGDRLANAERIDEVSFSLQVGGGEGGG
jgi:hypothetical protein